MNTAVSTLEQARQELLYLGLRNPLINYRHYAARGVEVVDERPSHVLRLLVDEGQEMSFLPLAEEQGSAASLTGAGEQGGALVQPEEVRHQDLYLQTGYESAVLQKRLLNSYYLARSTIEEQGVNILYLALGMLHWYERDTSDVLRRAPLLLIPVELRRADANAPFHLCYTGTDIGDNLSLRLKMQLDYGLDLPQLDTDTPNLLDYFQAVQQALAPQPRWSVDDTAVSLSFFSFNKFLLYNDLDPSHWPQTPPAQHPILQTLLAATGFPDAHSIVPDDGAIDQHIDLAQSHQVVDADSSQTLAILAVNEGRNLVIQGPPGTGKSQTITNLMAEALGQGKTVLFVSEKLAALEVVKRRLDEVGLGDAALELHSHKTTKSSFLAELGRTWSLGQPKEDGERGPSRERGPSHRFPDLSHLQTARDDLNAYHQAMNTVVGRSGLSAFHAYGRTIQLQAQLDGLDLPNLDNQTMRQWSQPEFETRLALVAELQAHLKQMDIPQEHAFWGCGEIGDWRLEIKANLQSLISNLRSASLNAQQTLSALQTAVSQLAHQLHVPEPQSLTAVAQLHDIGQRLLGAPNLFAVDVAAAEWHTQADAILTAIEAGQHIRDLRGQFGDWLIPEAWSQDALTIRTGLMAGRSRLNRLLSGDYRRAKQQLAGLCRSHIPPDWETQLAAIDAILEVQRRQPKLDEMQETMMLLFGIRWQGLESDWNRLLAVALWLTRLHKEIVAEERPSSLLDYLAYKIDKPVVEAALVDISHNQASYETAVQQLQTLIGMTEGMRERPFQAQHNQLQRYHNEAERFPEMVVYTELLERVRAELEIGDWRLGIKPNLQSPVSSLQSQLIEIANSWWAAGQHLATFFQYRWYRGLVEKAQAERPLLMETRQGQTADQFCQFDSEFLRHNRLRLMQDHWQRLSRYAAGGQAGLLQKEIVKKRNHLPIRHMMAQAGRAVQRLKPIFMMSPLSIAMFLPPESIEFDLVIFDEASQVRPVEAFGAILRGKQVVVVGDSRQLPPTMFFEAVTGESEEGGERSEEGEEIALLSSPFPLRPSAESVLDLFVAQNAPQRMLRWHYRSRHESLITVSNREFYERQLVIFPSPDAAKEEVGLVYHHLPQTAYDRGGTRTNQAEAAAVAQAVMQHAQTQPHLTLGVVAFSSSQREAIETELEWRRRQDVTGEDFFQAHPIEPFFVKNLENVQGDERDVILISVGYGRSVDGRLTMNFGPLNQAGGERRLNVLITRARRRCEIFTNLTAADIDLRRTEAAGVLALKTYLEYAQTGELAELAPTMLANRSPLADVVAGALQERGYRVERPLNEMVDLAVRDPQRPERFLLGIQLDGSRPPSARDRERIQPQVLRGLGWRFYRLWGSRWWQDAAAELAQLAAAIESVESPSISPVALAFQLERYADLSLGEERPIPQYTTANITIDLKAGRAPWIFNKLSGGYYYTLPQAGSYEFDAAAGCFVMAGQRPFQLQSTLYYYPEKDTFTFLNKFTLRQGKQREQLIFDEASGRFYENTFNSTRRRWSKVKRMFDPMSGSWQKVDEAPQSFPQHQHITAVVAPEVAAEVRWEAVWVAQIVAVEGPIHVEELERRLAQAIGLSRRSVTTKEIVRLARVMASGDGRYSQRGDFFYPTNRVQAPLRDWSNLPNTARKMELIAPEEIETAVRIVVMDAIAIYASQIPEYVSRLLGFRNVGPNAWQQIYEIVEQMVADGRLQQWGQQVVLDEKRPLP